jgi:hypothetical protein
MANKKVAIAFLFLPFTATARKLWKQQIKSDISLCYKRKNHLGNRFAYCCQ